MTPLPDIEGQERLRKDALATHRRRHGLMVGELYAARTHGLPRVFDLHAGLVLLPDLVEGR